MTEKQYQMVSEAIRRRKYGELIINLINKLVTFMIFVSYPGILLYAYYYDYRDLVRLIAVPAVSFTAVTIFRSIFNAKRPYEIYDFIPALKKDTSGRSFPSRHVFSAFMIAMTYYVVDARTSVDIFILAVILAALRVLGGVHFIKDVAAGAIIGILAGVVGYFVI